MGTLNELAGRINRTATAHGFWDEERNFGEMIALMHSELSEALEEHRENKPVVYFKALNSSKVWHDVYTRDGGRTYYYVGTTISVPKGSRLKPEGAAVELADCLIRILNTMASLGVNIDDVVEEKMAFNDGREHKHGKAYG